MIADLDPHDGRRRCSMASPARGMPAPQWRRRVSYVAAASGWWNDRVAPAFPPTRTALRELLPRVGLAPDVGGLGSGAPVHRRAPAPRAAARDDAGEPRAAARRTDLGAGRRKHVAWSKRCCGSAWRKARRSLLVTHDPQQAVRLAHRALPAGRRPAARSPPDGTHALQLAACGDGRARRRSAPALTLWMQMGIARPLLVAGGAHGRATAAGRPGAQDAVRQPVALAHACWSCSPCWARPATRPSRGRTGASPAALAVALASLPIAIASILVTGFALATAAPATTAACARAPPRRNSRSQPVRAPLEDEPTPRPRASGAHCAACHASGTSRRRCTQARRSSRATRPTAQQWAAHDRARLPGQRQRASRCRRTSARMPTRRCTTTRKARRSARSPSTPYLGRAASSMRSARGPLVDLGAHRACGRRDLPAARAGAHLRARAAWTAGTRARRLRARHHRARSPTLGVRLVGIDTASIDPADEQDAGQPPGDPPRAACACWRTWCSTTCPRATTN